jgi:hypothetical protein
MTRRSHSAGPLLFGLALAGLAAGGPAHAQGTKPIAPQWAYAFDLSCRKLGEIEFTKDTKKYGVEVFKDGNTGLGVFISQAGSVALASGFDVKAPLKDSKAPEWISGLDLKARKAGENEFTKSTKAHAMEVFHDTNSGNWVYVTERGLLGVTAGPRTVTRPGSLKAPVWLHAMDVRCRKAGQKEWGKDTPAFGIEVYRDANTDNLIYISDTGSIAVVSGVPSPEEAPKQGKAPEWLHGLDLQVRKVGEKDFTKATGKIGMEIFRDANNGCLVLITESGSIAVVPNKTEFKSPTPNPKDAKFNHGLDLSVRQAGEKDFTDKTQSFAMEVFREENVGITIYVSQAGAIAAVATKK